MGLDEVTLIKIEVEHNPSVATGIVERTSDGEVEALKMTGGETGRGKENGIFIVDRKGEGSSSLLD